MSNLYRPPIKRSAKRQVVQATDTRVWPRCSTEYRHCTAHRVSTLESVDGKQGDHKSNQLAENDRGSRQLKSEANAILKAGGYGRNGSSRRKVRAKKTVVKASSAGVQPAEVELVQGTGDYYKGFGGIALDEHESDLPRWVG
jgi:hypothetical protein